MSASLVGSEMCIRDSAKPGVSPCGSGNGSHGPPRVDEHSTLDRLVRQCTCLLYTSDAADDM
eukprot:1803013-Alexandrium_andersonii.AAC.1